MAMIDNLYFRVSVGTLVLKKQVVASMVYFNPYMLLFSYLLSSCSTKKVSFLPPNSRFATGEV